MKHGWTPHGWPCCKQAPVADRPAAVTACAMTWVGQAAPVEICQDCIGWALSLLHNRVSFVYSDMLRESRLVQDIRLAYAATPYNLIQGITVIT